MKISVIIVNYNTKELLKDCLVSLFEKNKNLQMEVIVVDNASSDGSIEQISSFAEASKDKKNVKFKAIFNKENLGFAKANNQGLREASGEYLLLLNSDTRMVEDSLVKMIDFMELHPKIGIASCQLVGEDGQIQPTGGFFPTLPRVFAWMFFLDDLPLVNRLLRPFHPHAPGFYTKDFWYQKEHLQDWVTGAFFLMRREVFAKIGFLDENFFMYVEEMEYCFRAKKAGWQVAYTPGTKIIHLGGKSGGSKYALLGEYRGLKYFYQKHQLLWQSLVLRFFLKAGALLRMFLFGIIKKDSSLKETYGEAFQII